LHERNPLDFIVMENVPEVERAEGGDLLRCEMEALALAGFSVSLARVDAKDFGVPQTRKRLFLIALRQNLLGSPWKLPQPSLAHKTVADTIADLPEPITYAEYLSSGMVPFHPNHWCMTPKSRRFADGTLTEGYRKGRSFKVLSWAAPSLTVSYGHREVHVHPACKRRLSVYEAMLLQGFPSNMVLHGSMSDQFSQVSEAVPPPLAAVMASSIRTAISKESPVAEVPQESSLLLLRARG
jgi:DNA (cytosine-5)-methyltransferase 1